MGRERAPQSSGRRRAFLAAVLLLGWSAGGLAAAENAEQAVGPPQAVGGGPSEAPGDKAGAPTAAAGSIELHVKGDQTNSRTSWNCSRSSTG